jgi:hypothetical protein
MANLNTNSTTTIFYSLVQVEAHYRKSVTTFVLASDWTTVDCAHTIVNMDRLGKIEQWIAVFEDNSDVIAVEREIRTDLNAIVMAGGVAVLVGLDSVVECLGVDAEVVDLGAAMVEAVRLECDRAGASWDLVLATQVDRSAPNQDKLTRLINRAKAALFSSLLGNPNGLIFTGLVVSQQWGLSEFELTTYMMGRTDRGLDRNNKNKFILAINPVAFTDRMITSKELPVSWGGNRLDACTDGSWNKVVVRETTLREAREAEAKQAIILEQQAAAQAGRDRLNAIIAAAAKELADKRLGLFEAHRSILTSYCKSNMRKGKPTKKAIDDMFSALGDNSSDTLFLTVPEARPHFEQWLVTTIPHD